MELIIMMGMHIKLEWGYQYVVYVEIQKKDKVHIQNEFVISW